MNTLTLSPLTAEQLATAAADLRNAALIVEHAGHTKGRTVEFVSGQVCALGAIELATYKKLDVQRAPLTHGFYGEYASDGAQLDRDIYRCDNAVKVFAEFVPSELCYACNDEEIERHAAGCTAGQVCLHPREPYDKVTHYNDAHCVSGDLLVNMLGLAADRALDAVIERRSLLSGDRLPVSV